VNLRAIQSGTIAMPVAVLYARADSIYKKIPGCDVWDMDRDARKFSGGMPIVAHPPCRAWGQLAHFAKPRPDEKELARSAVRLIREWGGVLEHPSRSKLWPDQGLPEPGSRDVFGGFTVTFPQFWFGHRAEKNTRFYVCGCSPKDLPEVSFKLGECTHLIGAGSREAAKKKLGIPVKPEVSRYEREATPAALAVWLVQVARLCFKK
jgi:hypothetical protein